MNVAVENDNVLQEGLVDYICTTIFSFVFMYIAFIRVLRKAKESQEKTKQWLSEMKLPSPLKRSSNKDRLKEVLENQGTFQLFQDHVAMEFANGYKPFACFCFFFFFGVC